MSFICVPLPNYSYIKAAIEEPRVLWKKALVRFFSAFFRAVPEFLLIPASEFLWRFAVQALYFASAPIARCTINPDSHNPENRLKISKEQQKTAVKPHFVCSASLGEELKKTCSMKTFWESWKPLRPKWGSVTSQPREPGGWRFSPLPMRPRCIFF